MLCRTLFGLALALFGAQTLSAQDAVEIASPLYEAQGEYAGTLKQATADNVADVPFGAQLIALTKRDSDEQRLRLVLYQGGLPGDGWSRGDKREQAEASLSGGEATFEHGWVATLRQGSLSFRSADGSELGSLKKVQRKSPTLGAAPPPGATVLFDGSTAENFANGRLVEGNLLGVGCDSKAGFGDHRIHLEFKTPFQPDARGQGRGNSGVYVQGRYECQVLDSFGLEGRQNECGGVYSIAQPILNACLPPESWQTYDIVFTGARFDGDRKVSDARMTVHLNGILVHDDLALTHATTAHRRPEGSAPGGLYLQDHGNPVVYRNIWVVEDDPNRTRNVLFIAGRGSHGYGSHEHKAGCLLLAKALDESGLNIKTTVVDLWPKDPDLLLQADAIVCSSDGGGGHPFLRHLGELEEVMARGVGLVCLHYAVEVPKGVPGERFQRWLGGYFETHWSVNPTWTASFTALPDHPVARGVSPFTIHDEWYFHMRFRPDMESVTPILSAVAPESTMRRGDGPHSGNPAVRAAVAAGEPQHVGWTRVRPDGGRAFGFTGAHVHWNWAHDDFRKVVLNAIAWCAGAEVPEGGIESATPDLEALQANQNSKPGKNFNAERVQKLIDSFAQK
ncbi:MAG: family 16 glycoside hydrolase [Planctomycetota bacterium]|nr:family 16 glycoside hydrolase [Planctomycetota bacterium]